MAGTLSIWIAATRPKTLSAAVAPVAMGCALAHGDGVLRWPPALAALAGALGIQVACNFANDCLDGVQGTDTSERLGPQRAVASGLIAPAAMLGAAWIALLLVTLPACVALCMMSSWVFAPLGALCAALAFAYSGGRWALSRTGLGEPVAFLFFGPVAVEATYAAQAGAWPLLPLAAGCAPGLFALALISVNNLRDVHTDRAAGRRTLAVRFGPGFSRWTYAASVVAVVPITAALALGCGRPWALAAAAVPLLLLPGIARILRQESGRALNRELAATGFALLLYGALFTGGWVA